MRRIETIHAVGQVLCHDVTRIIPGEWKGAQFRKGHVVTQARYPDAAEHGQGSSVCLGNGRGSSARK